MKRVFMTMILVLGLTAVAFQAEAKGKMFSKSDVPCSTEEIQQFLLGNSDKQCDLCGIEAPAPEAISLLTPAQLQQFAEQVTLACSGPGATQETSSEQPVAMCDAEKQMKDLTALNQEITAKKVEYSNQDAATKKPYRKRAFEVTLKIIPMEGLADCKALGLKSKWEALMEKARDIVPEDIFNAAQDFYERERRIKSTCQHTKMETAEKRQCTTFSTMAPARDAFVKSTEQNFMRYEKELITVQTIMGQ